LLSTLEHRGAGCPSIITGASTHNQRIKRLQIIHCPINCSLITSPAEVRACCAGLLWAS